jgi:hypothetical protein
MHPERDRFAIRFAGVPGALPVNPPDPLAERVSRFVGDWTKWGLDGVVAVGSGIFKGLQDGWNYSKKTEDFKRQHMEGISEALRLMPNQMRARLEKAFVEHSESLTLEELAPLFQMNTWSEVFDDPKIFNPAENPVKPLGSLSEGPMGIVLSMEIAERQELFYEYFRSLVPDGVGQVRPYQEDPDAPKALEAYHRMVNGVNKEEQMNFLFDSANPDRYAKARYAMGGVLGRKEMMPTKGDDAYYVARMALAQHYWRDGVRTLDGKVLPIQTEPIVKSDPAKPDVVLGYGAKDRLFTDVSRAIGAGTRGANAKELGKELPPSLLRGALAMDVIGQSDLTVIEDILGERDKEGLRVKVDRRNEFLALSGVVKSEKSQEVMSFMDSFSNLSGIEKFGLVAAAVYMATQMPGLTAGGLVLHFGMKMTSRDGKGLMDVLFPLIRGSSEYAKGFMPNAGPKNLTSDDALKRVDVMQRFLTKTAQDDLDSAVTGFSILGDMKLQRLQASLMLGTDNGAHPPSATLNIGSESFAFLRSTLNKTGVRSSAQNFFVHGPNRQVTDPRLQAQIGATETNGNLMDAGNALMVVYYLVAAREQKNRAMVKRIEHVRREMVDGRYESLPSKKVVVDGVAFNPCEEFMRLVRLGMENPPDMTLMEFVQQSEHIDSIVGPVITKPRAKGRGGPTVLPSVNPGGPTTVPSVNPGGPTVAPSVNPGGPTVGPSVNPGAPTVGPSVNPGGPTVGPSVNPGRSTVGPSVNPGRSTVGPSANPGIPSFLPGANPGTPSRGPSSDPGGRARGPSANPGIPSFLPGADPGAPSSGPSGDPGSRSRGPGIDGGRGSSTPGLDGGRGSSGPGFAPGGSTDVPGAGRGGPTTAPGGISSNPYSGPTTAPDSSTSRPSSAPSNPSASPASNPGAPSSGPTADPGK